MKISKKQINKAGEIIRNGTDNEKEQTIELLNLWRANHMLPLSNIRAIVDSRLKKLSIDCIVGQRLKRMPSIIGKITRFPDMSVSTMQDVGGIRIIVPKISDVKKVHDALIKKSKHEAVAPPKDYIENPKPDGYRSLHQVFKYQNEQNEDIYNMRIEIQIRTRLQHAWATAVETLGVIDKVSYKSGFGEEENRKFFKLASALFSLKEKSNVLEEYKHFPKDELVQKLKDVDQKQQILAKLKGISVLKTASFSSSTDLYFVLLLSFNEANNFSIDYVTSTDEKKATDLYNYYEKEYRHDPFASVVLVKSKNLKELKKAYPNYFLDTQYFVKTIEDIIKAETLQK